MKGLSFLLDLGRGGGGGGGELFRIKLDEFEKYTLICGHATQLKDTYFRTFAKLSLHTMRIQFNDSTEQDIYSNSNLTMNYMPHDP